MLKADGTPVQGSFFNDNAVALGEAVSASSTQILGGELVPLGTALIVHDPATAFLIIPFACKLLEMKVVFGGLTGGDVGDITIQRVRRTSIVSGNAGYGTQATQTLLDGAMNTPISLVTRRVPSTDVELMAGDEIRVGWGHLGSMSQTGLAIYLMVQLTAETLPTVPYP